jgi:hypothetical protein
LCGNEQYIVEGECFLDNAHNVGLAHKTTLYRLPL